MLAFAVDAAVGMLMAECTGTLGLQLLQRNDDATRAAAAAAMERRRLGDDAQLQLRWHALKTAAHSAGAGAMTALPAPSRVVEEWLDALDAAAPALRGHEGAGAAPQLHPAQLELHDATLESLGSDAGEPELEQWLWLLAGRALEAAQAGLQGEATAVVLDAAALILQFAEGPSGGVLAEAADTATTAARQACPRRGGARGSTWGLGGSWGRSGGSSGGVGSEGGGVEAVLSHAATAAASAVQAAAAAAAAATPPRAAEPRASGKASAAQEEVGEAAAGGVRTAALQLLWRGLVLAFLRAARDAGGPAWAECVPAQLLALVSLGRAPFLKLEEVAAAGGGGSEGSGGADGGVPVGPSDHDCERVQQLCGLVRRFTAANAAANAAARAAGAADAHAPRWLLRGAIPSDARADPAYGPRLPRDTEALDAARGSLSRLVGATARMRLHAAAAHWAGAPPDVVGAAMAGAAHAGEAAVNALLQPGLLDAVRGMQAAAAADEFAAAAAGAALRLAGRPAPGGTELNEPSWVLCAELVTLAAGNLDACVGGAVDRGQGKQAGG
jgi:hypothetical protein